MTAGIWNINLEQGTTWSRRVVVTDKQGYPVNLAGYTVRMQARETYDSPAVLDLSVGSGITLTNPTAGEFLLKITNEQSRALVFEQAIYDIEITAPNGDTMRLMQGAIRLSREVTL